MRHMRLRALQGPLRRFGHFNAVKRPLIHRESTVAWACPLEHDSNPRYIPYMYRLLKG